MSRWGDEKTIQFIHLYREYECLWNPYSSLYKNKIARNNAYTKIQEEFNLTVKDIKNKIKSLRSTYHQELNKVEKSKRSGVESSEVYKPSLSWFKEMDFLNDTFEYRKSIYTEIPPSSQTKTETVDKPQSSPPTSNTTVERSQSFSQATIKKTLQTKRKRVEQNETLIALQSLESISSAINNPRSNEDEFYYFGQSVAAQLRSLPLNNALDMQAKIQILLSTERSRLAATYSQTSTPYSNIPVSIHSEDTTDSSASYS